MSVLRRSRRVSTVHRSSSDLSDIDDIENLVMNRLRVGTPRKSVLKTPITVEEPKTPSSRTHISKRKSKVPEKVDETSNKSPENDEGGTPPKLQKFQTKTTPQSLFTPSRLLDRLSIEDSDDEADVSSKKTVETNRNKYRSARRVLNSAETNFLPGREKELEELNKYLSDHLINGKSGSMYVSGQPGTGKTACLAKILKSEEIASKFKKVYVNCTTISTIGSIYKKITAELNLKVSGRTEKDQLAAIENYLAGTHKMVLLVLDEIDQLVGQKQAVLYTIFEWPAKPKSKIILIGIANSLDLTDRLLTRLNAKCELKPKLMHFAPYTKQQIIDIFKSRLEEAGVADVFPPVTLQLLAAKVSSISGDVRRALDIGRRVVELAEQQKKGGAKVNLSEFGLDIQKLPEEPDEAFKPVQVNQVVAVLNNIYGASQNLDQDIEDAFPLQQKILLCCLMLMLRKEKNKDITIGRLHDVYKRVCSKRNIVAVGQAEFVSLCSLVETRGIIRIMAKKEPRQSKVILQWVEEEVNGALKDKQLIASILDDASCLSR